MQYASYMFLKKKNIVSAKAVFMAAELQKEKPQVVLIQHNATFILFAPDYRKKEMGEQSLNAGNT